MTKRKSTPERPCTLISYPQSSQDSLRLCTMQWSPGSSNRIVVFHCAHELSSFTAFTKRQSPKPLPGKGERHTPFALPEGGSTHKKHGTAGMVRWPWAHGQSRFLRFGKVLRWLIEQVSPPGSLWSAWKEHFKRRSASSATQFIDRCILMTPFTRRGLVFLGSPDSKTALPR